MKIRENLEKLLNSWENVKNELENVVLRKYWRLLQCGVLTSIKGALYGLRSILKPQKAPNHPYLEKAPIEAKIKANNIMKIMKM